MKKESNMGLLFLMAVGIVGLGLYYGATDNYGSGEIQLYHLICWVVLIIALLRALELVWEPVKFFWDQAWGKVQENRKNAPDPVNNASGDVLSGEEMQTAIIVPEASQRIFVEREYAAPVKEPAVVRESVMQEAAVHEAAVPEAAAAPEVIVTPPPVRPEVSSEEKKKKNKKKKK